MISRVNKRRYQTVPPKRPNPDVHRGRALSGVCYNRNIIHMKLRTNRNFHGWVYPHTTFIGSVVSLKHGAHVFSKLPKDEREVHEKFVYVGCVHGGSERIFERLEALKSDPPDYLIFTGDVTGSPEIERLKKHFYDEKEKNLESPYHKFTYFGDWAATLPRHRRVELLLSLSDSALKLVRVIKNIKVKGTRVFIVEGNWDNPLISGVRSIAGDDINGFFDTKQFLKDSGIEFIENIRTLETKSTLHVLLPYIVLLHWDKGNKGVIRVIREKIREAEPAGKSVIMVGHAEANWKIHHLLKRNPIAYGQRGMVIRNFGRAIAFFRPQEVIYPHQHSRIINEDGKLVDLSAKYLLEITKEKGVQLVDDMKNNTSLQNDIVATYIPYGYLAEEDFISV